MTVNDYQNYSYLPDELQGVQSPNALERIATNEKITRSSDDPALLAISESLRANESGLTQSVQNVNSALSYLEIGDSALSEQSDILDSIKEKLLQASTDTTNDEQRANIKNEINDLIEQFDNIASNTDYNNQTILQNSIDDKSSSNELQTQVGTNGEDLISTKSIQSNSEGLGLKELLNDSNFTAQSAGAYLDTIDNAIDTVSSYRGDLGSTASQLESSFTNLSSQVVNNSSALSTISNVDYANEVSNFSKQNILAQVGAFGHAQANNINQQAVLRLLI